jgi:hypothetical protein
VATVSALGSYVTTATASVVATAVVDATGNIVGYEWTVVPADPTTWVKQ